ncbi:conserved hypothetical protein [Cupriavidus taiwanensis]|uniref:Uncharacterized protein n=1 Tax=Cupriavidus taiwanensis TaxID=164546 RepID=A0A375CQH2_9BURK|nr:conserved hypothetical protein [Cupriavidus taiwanensis]
MVNVSQLRQPAWSAQGLVLRSVGEDPVNLRGLRFPFAVSVQVLAGTCNIAVPGQMLARSSSGDRTIEILKVSDLTLYRQAEVSFQAVACNADRGPSPTARNGYASSQKPVTSSLALSVFLAPHRRWCRAMASAALGFHRSSELSAALMKEGESFMDVVTTQRLMRFLFDGCCSTVTACALYGFPDRFSLNIELEDRFGVMPRMVGKITSRQPA